MEGEALQGVVVVVVAVGHLAGLPMEVEGTLLGTILGSQGPGHCTHTPLNLNPCCPRLKQ